MNSYDAADLYRIISNIIRFGIVSESTEDTHSDRIIVDVDGVKTPPIPWITQRAGNDSSWWKPTPGEQVVLISSMGNYGTSVALPAIYSKNSPGPSDSSYDHVVKYGDGAVISYNQSTHSLYLDLPDNATLKIKSTGGVKINGNLSVTGNISSTGDVSDNSGTMQEIRDTHSSHTHTGDSGGTTSPPN